MIRSEKRRRQNERAVRAAKAVARSHGLRCEDAAIVSDSSSILVHLRPAPVLARVAATTAGVRPDGARAWSRREVAVAAHLADVGAPVAPPSRELPPGPREHDGLPLTFWKLVDHDPDRPLDGAAVGRTLRELHEGLRDLASCPPSAPLSKIQVASSSSSPPTNSPARTGP